MSSVAVLGGRGFVGSAIVRALRAREVETFEVGRGDKVPNADILINAACPSKRLMAEQKPYWDFRETVQKTALLYYLHAGRFLQVSSISARYPRNSVYGRHRLAAEQIVGDSPIVRLGPMYGTGAVKGVLLDMIHDSPVYMDPETYYAFADVDWCAERIADIALGDKTNRVFEVGGRGAIRLVDLRDRIGSRSEFLPSDYLRNREDQDFISPDGPTPSRAVEWAKRERAARLPG